MNLEERLEALAADVGRLRKGTRDTEFDWHVDRIAVALEEILMQHKPCTAADLVNAGLPAERALKLVDRYTLKIRRMLGTEERDLRVCGLIE